MRELRGIGQYRLRLQWSRYATRFLGWQLLLPPLKPLQSVVTVHDMSHLHYPEFHPADRVAFLTKRLSATIQRASAVVAVSEATRQDILTSIGKCIKLPPISVVYPSAAGVTATQGVDVRDRYQLPAQFILSVGTLEPRKNVARLLQAYQQLDLALHQAWPLLLVGDKGWLTEEPATLQQRNHVRWLGFVPDADMPACIRRQRICLRFPV